MRVLFVGGGTAGHINPALAVAELFRKRHPEAEILYVGTPGGMESRLVPKAGFAFESVEIKGFSRRLRWKMIRYNFKALRCLLRCRPRVREILRSFKPDVVFGTGGYVSGPVIREAAKMGIRTIAHEQNAFPGVTTKLIAHRVDRLLVAVQAVEKHLPKGVKPIVVGNPVRQDILYAKRGQSRRELGIPQDAFVILSFGGSLGATPINEAVAEVMYRLRNRENCYHIHGIGRDGRDSFLEMLSKNGIGQKELPRVFLREYIDDMPRCLAACDVVISRAGAITLCEIEAAGRASILIPSPNVTENHQYHNAMVLKEAGAAVVIEEKDLTGQRLTRELERMMEDPGWVHKLAEGASSLGVTDSAERICDILEEVLQSA